jgi:hypothetical protein
MSRDQDKPIEKTLQNARKTNTKKKLMQNIKICIYTFIYIKCVCILNDKIINVINTCILY